MFLRISRSLCSIFNLNIYPGRTRKGSFISLVMKFFSGVLTRRSVLFLLSSTSTETWTKLGEYAFTHPNDNINLHFVSGIFNLLIFALPPCLLCMLSHHFHHDRSCTIYIILCAVLIIDLTLFFSLMLKSMAVGNPAKVVGYTEKEDPSLTMKHGKYVHRFFLSCVF